MSMDARNYTAGPAAPPELRGDLRLASEMIAPGSRVLDEGYGINRVGIAVAKERADMLSYCSDFVGDAKASGLIAGFIAEAGLRGFAVTR